MLDQTLNPMRFSTFDQALGLPKLGCF